MNAMERLTARTSLAAHAIRQVEQTDGVPLSEIDAALTELRDVIDELLGRLNSYDRQEDGEEST